MRIGRDLLVRAVEGGGKVAGPANESVDALAHAGGGDRAGEVPPVVEVVDVGVEQQFVADTDDAFQDSDGFDDGRDRAPGDVAELALGQVVAVDVAGGLDDAPVDQVPARAGARAVAGTQS